MAGSAPWLAAGSRPSSREQRAKGEAAFMVVCRAALTLLRNNLGKGNLVQSLLVGLTAGRAPGALSAPNRRPGRWRVSLPYAR